MAELARIATAEVRRMILADLQLREVRLAADLVLKLAIVGLGVFSTVLVSMLYFNL
jgi:hypothetical protein